MGRILVVVCWHMYIHISSMMGSLNYYLIKKKNLILDIKNDTDTYLNRIL